MAMTIAEGRVKHPRRKDKKIGPEDANLIRAMYRDHLKVSAEIIETEQKLLDLMDLREQQRSDYALTSAEAIAKKFEIAVSAVAYVCRARSKKVV